MAGHDTTWALFHYVVGGGVRAGALEQRGRDAANGRFHHGWRHPLHGRHVAGVPLAQRARNSSLWARERRAHTHNLVTRHAHTHQHKQALPHTRTHTRIACVSLAPRHRLYRTLLRAHTLSGIPARSRTAPAGTCATASSPWRTHKTHTHTTHTHTPHAVSAGTRTGRPRRHLTWPMRRAAERHPAHGLPPAPRALT